MRLLAENQIMELILADGSAEFRKGEKRDQHHEDHEPDQQLAFETSSSEFRKAYGESLAMKQADQDVLHKIEANQDDCEEPGFKHNRCKHRCAG